MLPAPSFAYGETCCSFLHTACSGNLTCFIPLQILLALGLPGLLFVHLHLGLAQHDFIAGTWSAIIGSAIIPISITMLHA